MNKYSILLVDPPSVHHGPPDTIIAQDTNISSRYSQEISRRVSERLSQDGVGCWTAVNARYVSNYGLLMIGTLLSEKSCNVIYENGDYYPDIEDFISVLLSHCSRIDAICFTCTTPQYSTVSKIGFAIKEQYQNIKLFLGGPHALCFRDARPLTPFDIVLTGYSVRKSVDVILDFCDNQQKPYPVVIPVDGYDDVPKNFGLIPPDKLPYTLLYSYSSFGCPNSCRYCVERKLIPKPIFCISDSNFTEIKYLVNECNVKFLHLADSDFFINTSTAERFLRVLVQDPIQACFSVNTNPRTIISRDVQRLISRFSQSGLVELLIGVEYFSPSVLRLMNKEYSIERFFDALKTIRKENPKLIISFYSLLGLPGVTKATQVENYNWFKLFFDYGLVDFSFPKFFVPYPGTDIFQTPDAFGVKILNDNWDNYHRWAIPRALSVDSISENDIIEELRLLYVLAENYLTKT